MQSAPEWYTNWRATLNFDTAEYEGCGIQLYLPDELPRGQVGIAVKSNGESLVGIGPGDWRPEWIVIGYDTACGDPIFASDEPPHPVFNAMHGEGSWEPKLVAPSLEGFAACLRVFQAFAAGRSIPLEIEVNPPTRQQQAQFLAVIRRLTDSNQNALNFWAVQIDLDLDAFDCPEQVQFPING